MEPTWHPLQRLHFARSQINVAGSMKLHSVTSFTSQAAQLLIYSPLEPTSLICTYSRTSHLLSKLIEAILNSLSFSSIELVVVFVFVKLL